LSVKISIIGPAGWDARPPKDEPELVGRASRIIFHHTAGRAPNATVEGAKEYARRLQKFHMDTNGWNDSGHNFLVCRNGSILVGRWFTVRAIQRKLMVRSAHCPGQNDQIGIEHEHVGAEKMTAKQVESAARLQAWIADRYNRKMVLPVDPHSRYIATACPANLKDDIPRIRRRAQQILDAETSV
jgi:hypothetical protein